MSVTQSHNRSFNAAEAISLVSDACHPLDSETIMLEHAHCRVLRESIHAPGDQPSFDRSAVDGYAVRIDDPAFSFVIVDQIRAGEWKPQELEPNQAVRIATGGALPCAGLQVVMKEDVAVDGAKLTLNRRDHNELNIRHRGEDARKGDVLMKPGTVLNPGALALLAGIGHTQLLATRLPRVVHAATGNEIVPPEATPKPGQIRDTNSILVGAFLNQWNIKPDQLRLAEDESAARAKLTKESVSQTDILLISGGASVGEHDFTRSLLEHLGYTIQICRTNTRPGKPLIFGTRGNGVAFGLPGNPLAHFVCLNLFVRAAINKLSGSADCPSIRTGTLGSDLNDITNARETLWPSQVDYSTGSAAILPLRWSSSGDLTCLANAKALALVPAGCQSLPKGALVSFFPVGISP